MTIAYDSSRRSALDISCKSACSFCWQTAGRFVHLISVKVSGPIVDAVEINPRLRLGSAKGNKR
jgi:hypothetical protein